MTTARDVIALAIQRFIEMDTMCDAYLEEADEIIAALERAPAEVREELVKRLSGDARHHPPVDPVVVAVQTNEKA